MKKHWSAAELSQLVSSGRRPSAGCALGAPSEVSCENPCHDSVIHEPSFFHAALHGSRPEEITLVAVPGIVDSILMLPAYYCHSENPSARPSS